MIILYDIYNTITAFDFAYRPRRNRQARELVIERFVSENAESAFRYARVVIGGIWPPGERILASSAAWANRYAFDIVKGRWSPGEESIMTHPGYLLYYRQMLELTLGPDGRLM